MTSTERLRYLEQANSELKQLGKRWFQGEINQSTYRQDRGEVVVFLLEHARSLESGSQDSVEKRSVTVTLKQPIIKKNSILTAIREWLA